MAKEPELMDIHSVMNLIIEQRKQGKSEYDIVRELLSQGYSSDQIYSALNEMDNEGITSVTNANKLNQSSQIASTEQEHFGNYNQDELFEKIQEISETIIAEKWDELIANVEKIVKWKDRIEERILEIEQNMASLDKEVSKLYDSVFSKMKEYDEHTVEFGTDLKAMQKVFKDMLPQFVTGIHELNAIVKRLSKMDEIQDYFKEGEPIERDKKK